VPGEFWDDLTQLLVAGAIVAALVMPAGLVAWVTVSRRGKPLLSKWQPWRAPWGCFEVLLALLVIQTIIPTFTVILLSKSITVSSIPLSELPSPEGSAAAGGMPATIAFQEQAEYDDIRLKLLVGVLAFPFQLSLLICVSRILYPSWWFITRPALSSQVMLAVLAWVVITPLIHAVNLVVKIIFTLMNWQSDTHQLTKLAGRPLFESTLLAVQACIAAPLIEEMLFRGVILAWAIGGRKPSPAPDIPARIRPWVIVLAALGFAAISVKDHAIVYSGRDGATIFASLLIAGLGCVDYFLRTKRRTVCAVYSSAALFAAVHSSVWPSPIPLFLLALGLGWLAVRTRGVLVPAIVHGLFNAVSTVLVLRGAG
jgi:membrane protease YdiL (CAAX protease family)